MTAELPGEPPRAAAGSELAGLLAKVARGDEAAFAGVYDHFATAVYGSNLLFAARDAYFSTLDDRIIRG